MDDQGRGLAASKQPDLSRFSARALVSTDEAITLMKMEGKTDYSPEAIRSWQWGYLTRWSDTDLGGQDRLEAMAEDLVAVLNTDKATEALSDLVKTKITQLLTEKHHSAFSKGFERALFALSKEKADSIYSGIGVRQSQLSTSVDEMPLYFD